MSEDAGEGEGARGERTYRPCTPISKNWFPRLMVWCYVYVDVCVYGICSLADTQVYLLVVIVIPEVIDCLGGYM